MSRKNRNVNSNNHLIEISVAGLSKQPPEVFCKKGVLRNFSKFTGKHLYQSLFFNKVAGQAYNFIKKESLAHVFSCEFWEISKDNFSTEHLRATASGTYS